MATLEIEGDYYDSTQSGEANNNITIYNTGTH